MEERWRSWGRWAVRELPRGLLGAVLTGSSAGPRSRSWWVRVLAVILSVAAGYFVGVGTFFTSYVEPVSLRLTLAVLSAVPIAFTWWFPLLAWRVLLILLVVTPLLPVSWGVTGPWSPFMLVSALVVLYLVALRTEFAVWVWAWLLTVGAFALAAATTADVLQAGAIAAVLMLLGDSVRRRRQAEREKQEQEERRRAEEAAHAVLQERSRIARELHDVVAHHMSLLAVQADTAQYRLPDLPESARTEFGTIAAGARDALNEMRRLLGVLRGADESAQHTPQPGVDQIDAAVDRLRATGVEVTKSVTGEAMPLPASVDLSAYRIVQEALSNVARHAPGADAHVELGYEPDQLRIEVRNGPSTGTAPAAEPESERVRHGLVNVRERVGVLGGDITVGPTPEGGFLLAVTLPLKGSA
ncbi:sensor histidine kinase [Longimycelium tulufanense]|uniref:sensor histidine kinase n=1 Tax=Longimycelium tulufanense TaxID=907463 RepID=UPI001666D802|nr:sensor histidine kinase [Longimycelium tulufanense]